MGYLTQNTSEGSAYYGDFRGVDFSSDHTQVNRQRLAYAVNMFRDYQSGQGRALETIAGFRRRFESPNKDRIYGIHELRDVSGGVLVHSGNKLYLWRNYPESVNILKEATLELPQESANTNGTLTFLIPLAFPIESVADVKKASGESILANTVLLSDTKTLEISRGDLSQGDLVQIQYYESVMQSSDAIYSGMNERKSESFVFNNRLYIIDGKNYLVFDGKDVKNVSSVAYVPTTYINIIPSGENASIGVEYEQRNILSPNFKHTFIADGETTEFYMNENNLDSIVSVKVYDAVVDNYEVDLAQGKITFSEAPKKPKDENRPEFYAGIEITASKRLYSASGITQQRDVIEELVTECTLVSIFDNRVFMSGNPAFPNHVFYCGRNLTGYVDPTYFGILNYVQDGIGNIPITGMVAVADTLMVLKNESQQDGSTFFHKAMDSSQNLLPRIYPSTQGLNGIGCLGACINFLDDPVFVSKLGLEGVSQLSVRLERAIEHRSSMVDAKLVNMNLEDATLTEWNGYLVLNVNGCMFLADSRQKFSHDTGSTQYEWYYLEDIGVYDGQYTEYRYSEDLPPEFEGKHVRYCPVCKRSALRCDCATDDNWISVPIAAASKYYNEDRGEYEDRTKQIANPPSESGTSSVVIHEDDILLEFAGIEYTERVYFTIYESDEGGDEVVVRALLCSTRGNKTGGVFKPAVITKVLDDNLFFGTNNGTVCSFNFDMREADGEIHPKYYTFDDRVIYCGCATRMDNCDIPHLTKSTVKKSTVIKTKSFLSSAAKIKVRTNKKPYEQIARINSEVFSFDNVDFTDLSFSTTENSLFAVREAEKKWVEKQYFLYSDEYMKPFSVYYIAYRYNVVGRYKQ